MKAEIRQSLWLWGSPTPDTDPTEMASKLKNCQIAVDLFLEGKLSLLDYLDIIADQSVNIDDYLEIVDQNLKDLGVV